MNLTSNDQLTYFAHDWTDKDKLIGLAQPDRRYHFYTLGRSGMGKSTMLFSKIVQDLQAGRGLALIDPHGDLAEAVLPFVPKERAKNLVYLNPTDDYPISLNPLDRVGDLETHLVADNLLAIFHKIWADSWGPRLSYVLQHGLVALIENHRTLLALPKLLTDAKVAKKLINKLKRVYGFKKKSIFIADAAYDEKDMYNFIVEQLKCQAFIPINPRNTQPEKTFGPKGLPLCDADLEMKSNGKCKEAKRERIKFRCPLKTDKTIAQKYPEGCPVNHPRFFEGKQYGCTKYLDITNDAKAKVPRDTRLFKETYKLSTEVERYFSRLGNREIEQTTHYESKAIKNQMTIAHMSLSLVAYAAAILMKNPHKIRCFRTFAQQPLPFKKAA